jgi:phosphatidylinositol alpha-1,6-mannosyltransferase
MRIGIVSPEFPPDIGGVETYAFEYVKELAGRGHEVTVFTVRHPQGEVSFRGVRIEPSLRLCRSIDRATFMRHDADVWHALNAAYAWLAVERRNSVVSVHGNDFLRPYFPVAQPDLRRLPGARFWSAGLLRRLRPLFDRRTSRLVRDSLARAPHIIANSRYTEAVLLEVIPGCRGRTSVGFVGVGARFFDVEWQPARDAVPRLLTVSRLSEPRKNIDQVLRALARLKDRQEFRYTIVGGGYDRARLEALAGELRLGERVQFAGFVSQEELLDLYAHSDLMVLASAVIPGSHEGFGIVYLEAAASGVPSLAARVGGAAEAVDEGKSGMYVEEPSVEALTIALGSFLSGDIQFDRAACRDFALRFAWKNVVDHSLQHYPASSR